jgi:hypothetical protein
MRKTLFAGALALATLGIGASTVDAAPPSTDANPNAVVVGLTCEGYNNGEVFEVWAPNARSWYNPIFDTGHHSHLVGQPIAVDVPVGVQMSPSDRTVTCVVAYPLTGLPVTIMPTGKP